MEEGGDARNGYSDRNSFQYPVVAELDNRDPPKGGRSSAFCMTV
jgi:hypothetical protein